MLHRQTAVPCADWARLLACRAGLRPLLLGDAWAARVLRDHGIAPTPAEYVAMLEQAICAAASQSVLVLVTCPRPRPWLMTGSPLSRVASGELFWGGLQAVFLMP